MMCLVWRLHSIYHKLDNMSLCSHISTLAFIDRSPQCLNMLVFIARLYFGFEKFFRYLVSPVELRPCIEIMSQGSKTNNTYLIQYFPRFTIIVEITHAMGSVLISFRQ